MKLPESFISLAEFQVSDSQNLGFDIKLRKLRILFILSLGGAQNWHIGSYFRIQNYLKLSLFSGQKCVKMWVRRPLDEQFGEFRVGKRQSWWSSTYILDFDLTDCIMITDEFWDTGFKFIKFSNI